MTNTSLVSAPSRFFFPLRTNMTYNANRPNSIIHIIETIKRAAVLYDELAFEGGLYQAVVTSKNNFEIYTPPEMLRDIDIEMAKTMAFLSNGPFSLTFGTKDSNALVFSDNTVDRFACEYHTVLQSLDAMKLPWITTTSIGLTDQGKAKVKQLTRNLEKYIGEEVPQEKRFLQHTLLSNLARDLIDTVIRVKVCLPSRAGHV